MSLATKIVVISAGSASFGESTLSALSAGEQQSFVKLTSGHGRVVSQNIYELFVTPSE